jgi:hypothetical protein
MGTAKTVLEDRQLVISEEKAGERRRLPTEDVTLGGKSIVTLQFCINCNRTFAPQRGRKRCPSCQELLRSKTLVIKL